MANTPLWLDTSIPEEETPTWLQKPKYAEDVVDSAGFKNIPEGNLITNMTTGKPAGRAYPSLGQVATPQTPLSEKDRYHFGQVATPQSPLPKPPVQPSSGWDIPGTFATGTKKFVAGALGMPVDILNMAMMGAGGEQPVGGSASINALLNRAVPDYQAPENIGTKVAGKVGEFLPSVALGPVMAGRQGIANFGKIAAQGVPSAVGAGAGAGVAESVYPDSYMAEFAGSVIGGGVPAASQAVVRSLKNPNLTSTIDKTLNGIARVTREDLNGLSGGSIEEVRRNGVDGVKTFVLANKDQPFVYKNLTGGVAHTGLPETRIDFADAIGQLKTRIYTNYNNMQKAAGGKGLMFDGDEIAGIIRNTLDDPNLPPSAADMEGYIAKQLAKYQGKQWTPQQIENELAHLNAKLRAHGRNPNMADVNTANVDSKILSALNKELDNSISRLEGDGYSAVRHQYGTVRALQDRIGRAALAQLKEEATPNKGPLGLFEMGLGAGTLYGMSHDPLYALAGAAVFGGKYAAKQMAQPDRRMRKMFAAVDKYIPPKEKWGPLPKAERPMPAGEGGPTKLLERPIIEGEIVPPQKQLRAPYPELPLNRGFTTKPYSGDVLPPDKPGVVPPERRLHGPTVTPEPTNALPSPGRTADVKPVDAGWTPTLRMGAKPGVFTMDGPQGKVDVDIVEMRRKLGGMGYSEEEIGGFLKQLMKVGR